MWQMSKDADFIWDRALLDGGGTLPRTGDLALSRLLQAHGLAMNGGVFHAVELLAGERLVGAKEGYRFFGYPQVANLFERARHVFSTGRDIGSHEQIFDNEYSRHIPDDSALVARFEACLHSHPEDFAPL